MVIEQLAVTGGYDSRNGGGILVEDSVGVVIRDCVVSGNEADYDWFVGSGGGICAIRSEVVIERCLIYRNTAEADGGGIFLACSGKVCKVIGCEFMGNTTSKGSGGGVNSYCLVGDSGLRDRE